jgi:hypothetical protein
MRYGTCTASLYSYETIRLRTYMDIVRTGNILLLVIKGKPDPEICYDAFETIIKKNSEANGNFSFDNTLDLKKVFGMLIADYVAIKAALTVLLFQVDDNLIEFLAEKGYRVETTITDEEKKEGKTVSQKYVDSIRQAMRVSDSINTRLQSKQIELDDLTDKAGRPMGFEELIACVSAGIGFGISPDISLAGFNEYQRIIRQRNAPKERPGYERD